MGLVWDTVWPLWSVPVDGSPLSLCWRSDLVANVEKPYSIPFMCLVARERERSPWLTPLQIGMDTVSVTVSISVLQVKRCATCFSHNWLVSSMVWLSGLLHWPYTQKSGGSAILVITNFLAFVRFYLTIFPSWIRIRILNADPDPGVKMNANPCGSGSTALS